MANTIVYLSHGDQKFHDQTCYSVLSMLDLMRKEQYDDLEIVVYTDRPDSMPRHPHVQTIRLDAATLKAWREPLGYVHRIKLETLRRACDDVGLPFIYVDGDTRWRQLPRAPFATLVQPMGEHGEARKPPLYLHVCEAEIAESFHPELFGLLQRSPRRLTRFGIKTSPPWRMWNTGTIAAPAGAESFFAQALALTDELLLQTRKRLFIEQLALSLIADSHFEVRPFEPWLHHYWPYNTEAAILLRREFEQEFHAPSSAEQLRHYAAFKWDEAAMRAIQNSPDQRRANWRAKLRNSFHKRRIDMKALWLCASLPHDE